jgi:CRP-like cAMP-binding protein
VSDEAVGVEPPGLPAPDFDDARRAALDALLADNPQRRFGPGAPIMTEGATADWFAFVRSGSAEVSRHSPTGPVPIGVARPGSIVGELALITGGRRRATVTATTDVVIACGDIDDLHRVLSHHEVAESVARIVADRLARLAEPIDVTLADGHRLKLRPGLSSDGSALAAGLAAMSRESLRRRFFSSGTPPEPVVRYLLDVNYVDHFAWVAIEADNSDAPIIGSARFVRSKRDSTHADLGIGLIDRVQGRGIGTLLIEALGVAATTAGIEYFTADVLRENAAMRALLRRPSTHWKSSEPGVVHALTAVADYGATLDPEVRRRISVVASSIIWNSAAVLL